MTLSHNGKKLLALFKQKESFLIKKIYEKKIELSQIEMSIQNKKIELNNIHIKMREISFTGVLDKIAIDNKFRQQAIFLIEIQLINDKITGLEQEKESCLSEMNDFQLEMKILNKKYHKLSFYLESIKKKEVRIKDMNIENEIEEVIGYDRKYSSNESK